MSAPAPTAIAWQGVNHIALVTRDLDATIQFYRELLGVAPRVVLPPGEGHGRHALLAVGGASLGLHFFEDADAQIFTHPDALGAMHRVPGALQHIALTLPDEATVTTLRERLEQRGILTTALMDQGVTRGFLFLDNNGILLEAACFKSGLPPAALPN
jgi:catechol 2,3-dioxygenase-like lactoylglutathione lyase family enzyme